MEKGMIITGENILKYLDELIDKKVRMLSLEEGELFGTGFVGKIKKISKQYIGEGHFNTYIIKIDFRGFEKNNIKHDIGGFGPKENKKWSEMKFYEM